MQLFEEFVNNLRKLSGAQCRFVFFGPTSGSVISIDFGDLVPLTSPLMNPHLSEAERRYRGTFTLFAHCVWRIESENEVIGGCWEDSSDGGPMDQHLNRLVGQVVESIDEITLPGLDLTIRFSSGDVLRIFCDRVEEHENPDNYSLFVPDKIFTVGCRSVLQCEERDADAIA